MSGYHAFKVYVSDEDTDVSEAFNRLNDVKGVIEVDYEDSHDD